MKTEDDTSARTPRILIVDDNLRQIDLFITLLQFKGFETDEAASGETALKKLRENHYDLMITDLRLRGMSGEDLIVAVRAAGMKLPIFIRTGRISSLRFSYHKLGADGYFNKGPDDEELLRTLDTILRHHEVSPEADLSGAKLSFANLRGANLGRADLSGARLAYADLSKANLSGANLREANLVGANLRDANLSGANLRRASLREANLIDADLYEANLSVADLSEADLNNAKYNAATQWPTGFDPEAAGAIYVDD